MTMGSVLDDPGTSPETESGTDCDFQVESPGAIPIANLYHLLCYAWDFFKIEGVQEVVHRDDHRGYTELLLKVLNYGCVHLLKQGLHRDYVVLTEAIPAMRGKWELGPTLATGKLLQGQTICTYDDFTVDIPANQILKSVLLRFSGLKGIDPPIGQSARATAMRMAGVRTVDLDLRLFNQVHIHRNNAFYGFLLSICRLLMETVSVRERMHSLQGVEQRFEHVLSERLPALFEAFVRNFYRKHLGGAGWSRFQAQRIDWLWTALTPGSAALLPQMITDITLEHADRKIILDTKFYGSGGINERGKFESANLYQLSTYVTQLALQAANGHATHPHDHRAEGMLLYASTREAEYCHRFEMPPHRMTVASVDLARPWAQIEERLRGLIVP
jgi:5-methylcytosine-specific restriction enzyme subunit McrC